MSVQYITGETLDSISEETGLTHLEIIKRIREDPTEFQELSTQAYKSRHTQSLRGERKTQSFRTAMSSMERRRRTLYNQYRGVYRPPEVEFKLYRFEILEEQSASRSLRNDHFERSRWTTGELLSARMDAKSILRDRVLITGKSIEGCAIAFAIARKVENIRYEGGIGRIGRDPKGLLYRQRNGKCIRLRLLFKMGQFINRERFSEYEGEYMWFPLCYNPACLMESHMVYESKEQVESRKECSAGEACMHEPKCMIMGKKAFYKWEYQDTDDSEEMDDEEDSDDIEQDQDLE